MEPSDDPLLIAGVGGSGTRVLPRIMRRAGHYMGSRLNPADDALDFREFASRWTPPYLHARREGRQVEQWQRMRDEFLEAVSRFRVGIDDPSRPWGWKQPRSIHLLPFLHERFPGLRFMHVLRDGRDIAFGKPNPIVWVGDYVLGPDHVDEPLPLRMIRYWARVNDDAADYAESALGERYLPVRFEDLCDDPSATIRRILAFCLGPGADVEPTPEMVDEVQQQPTTGQWRRADPEIAGRVVEAGAAALERFGYTER